ncbi:MAG: alpha/beta hydrolase family protein, partial [Candidatus Saliniplasma sp.]
KIDDLKETEDMEVKESILTLKYKYDQILKDIGDLKSYEPFDEIQKDMKKLFSDFDKVKKGRSLYNPGEVLRMAYKSGYDGTLQPYSIYIPEGEKNSLMVFLRGSGSDDRSVFGNPYVKKLADEHGIIILAPFARGTSHAFCPDEALEEVREVTNKITQLLPVDENKVILAGFSMGGYGVLRNFDYHGDLYKGLVIISGMYSFGKEFKEFIGDFKIPDYSERIETFQDIPMIFFHGKEDKNCHYDKMESFIEKLATVNDEIEFHAAENLGHSGLTEEWFKKLSDWIEQNF